MLKNNLVGPTTLDFQFASLVALKYGIGVERPFISVKVIHRLWGYRAGQMRCQKCIDQTLLPIILSSQ